MKTVMLGAVIAMLATQSAALSCMRPDPVTTFNRVAADEASYYVLHGTITFDTSLQPTGVVNHPRDPVAIPAEFRGTALTLEGFTVDFSRAVTVQPICAGPWCGNAPSGVDALMFARIDGREIIVEATACGDNIFTQPSQAVIDQMTQCIRGESCLPQPFE